MPTPQNTAATFPPQCTPDAILSREQLEALYNDFLTMSSTLPTSSVFANLVNNVRQLCRSGLDAQDAKHREYVSELTQRHEQQLLQIERERKGERAALAAIAAVSGTGALQEPSYQIPEIPYVLYVRGRDKPRCDMVEWTPTEWPGWSHRLQLKVFKLEEVDTVKVMIGHLRDPHRMHVSVGNAKLPKPWSERFCFYAFESEKPGTEMVSVGQALNPERCILVKGKHADRLAGWEEKCVFWVLT